jgi:integrase
LPACQTGKGSRWPAVTSIMGWSSAEMAARYQHVLDSIRKCAADQVGGLLWGTEDDDNPDDDGTAGESVPA